MDVKQFLENELKLESKVAFKHFSMKDYYNAVVYDKSDTQISVKSKFSFGNSFFPGDTIIFNVAIDKKFYFMACVINEIKSLVPINFTLDVLRVEELENCRDNKRFFVSLTAEISTLERDKSFYASVGNISYNGLKLSTKERDFNENDVIITSVELESDTKIEFNGTICRKQQFGAIYDYGIEILKISDIDKKKLEVFLEGMEKGLQ